MCAGGQMTRVLVLGAIATILAPHLALAELSVANEDSPKVAAAVTPGPSGVSKRSNDKIGMVVATLQDILQSVANEEAAETAIFNQYTSWCKTTQDYHAADIPEGNKYIQDSKVLAEEQLSSIDSLKLFVAQSEQEIEQTKDAMAQADNLRTKESEQYTEDMQFNTQSLKQIELAIKHVNKVNHQGGFLQNGATHKIQINVPGESNYVTGVMKGLEEKLEKTGASLQAGNKEKEDMHDSFMKTKGESLNVLDDTITAKKILLTETTARHSGVERRIGKITEEVDRLTKDASTTAETCQKTRQNWKVRQEDRANEKAALSDAINYLTKTALVEVSSVDPSLSFLQTAGAGFSQHSDDAAFDEIAHRAFKGMTEDTEDAQVHMHKGMFSDVKSIVSKLIDNHQDTQHEEKTKRDYCENEMASKEDERLETANTLAAVEADIGKKMSEVDMLADEVKSLYTSIDQLRSGLEEAHSIRKQQAAVFEGGSKDRALALKVLKQAKDVLEKFYEEHQGKFLQQHQVPPQSSRKTAATFGAVSMVIDIADDIAKEQKDAAIQEKQAVDAFAALQEDSRESTDAKHQDVTDRVKAKAKLGVQINTMKESHTQKFDDLNAIMQQLNSLHKECDELVQHYGKRKEARAFEVSQLHDVMDVLSGSSLASRTGGFLQTAEGALRSP